MSSDAQISPELTARACARHPEKQTRLSCTQCSTPICPDCMIMCEVGFKCPSCINNIKSHLSQVSIPQYSLAIVLTLIVSQVYGWLHPLMLGIPFLNILGVPLLGLLISYFIGLTLGKGVHSLSGRKFNTQLKNVLILVFVLGLSLGPIGSLIVQTISFLWASFHHNSQPLTTGTTSDFYILGLLIQLLAPYCFWEGYKNPFSALEKS